MDRIGRGLRHVGWSRIHDHPSTLVARCPVFRPWIRPLVGRKRADGGHEERAAEGGEAVEHATDLEEVAHVPPGHGDAQLHFEAEGFEVDAGLGDHFGVEHGGDARAGAGVVFAEGVHDQFAAEHGLVELHGLPGVAVEADIGVEPSSHRALLGRNEQGAMAA